MNKQRLKQKRELFSKKQKAKNRKVEKVRQQTQLHIRLTPPSHSSPSSFLSVCLFTCLFFNHFFPYFLSVCLSVFFLFISLFPNALLHASVFLNHLFPFHLSICLYVYLHDLFFIIIRSFLVVHFNLFLV